MAIDRKALLAGYAGKSKMADGGDYLRDGKYPKLEIVKLLIEKKQNGNMFIAELIVHESSISGEEDAAGKLRPCHAPGSRPSACFNLDDKWGYGLGDMKRFICALENVDPKAVTDDQAFEWALGYTDADQPAKGMLIADYTFNKATKTNKIDRTNHRWENVVQTEAEIAQRRALQEKKPAA